ncbi:MAG: hypothetical protein J7L35_00425 [Anaerolineales bacterium]|nr:hypothetical protein [Anaerolineales bacterium]MCK5794336.1 hypothetical protein [Anaerolineales bacterium]
MKINPDHYPVIIILALVLFTILGLALGFLPSRSGEEHNLIESLILFI